LIVSKMSFVSLVHPAEQKTVQAVQLTTKCDLFRNNPELLTRPFSVKSSNPVSVSVFREFVSALEDCEIEITTANVAGLSELSAEFGFASLSKRLSAFRLGRLSGRGLSAVGPIRSGLGSDNFTVEINGASIVATAAEVAGLSPAAALLLSVDSCVRFFSMRDDCLDLDIGLNGVCDLAWECGVGIVGVSDRSVGVIFGSLGNSELESAFLGYSFGSGSESESESRSLLSVYALASLLSEGGFGVQSEDFIVRNVFKLGRDYLPLLGCVGWSHLSLNTFSRLDVEWDLIPPESFWRFIADSLPHLLLVKPTGFDSVIISEFPDLFADFAKKRFNLLWRGSRDGFGADPFHERCDGHANTLTLIRDTAWNIFGGFTPLKWESRAWNRNYGAESNLRKGDASLKSFLFTLKNPHDLSARKFVLNRERKDRAIDCDSKCGPCFGTLWLSDHCNTHMNKSAFFGDFCAYINDSGVDGQTLFTGSPNFRADEVEVFEITD
jgi:hypothetical protein